MLSKLKIPKCGEYSCLLNQYQKKYNKPQTNNMLACVKTVKHNDLFKLRTELFRRKNQN